ncbi:BBP7 family outer membrane beta-barrel protein [Gimesia sp.]|uniref:BBP7 family outer membrane beta-barrel protein n=1 Tax=Gimesia sp. TaxID=2024833 RepID=UPI003A914558
MSRTSWKVMMITPFRLSALLVLLCSTGLPVGMPKVAADDGTTEYVMHGDADMVDEEIIDDSGLFSGVNTYSRSLVRQLPVDRGWTYDSPIDKSIKGMFRSSSLKLEYLHWSLDGPDNVLLSAPILGVTDPTEPNPVFDRSTGIARGDGVALNYSDSSMDTNGMRATLAFPVEQGAIEWNTWGIFKNESTRPTASIYATQSNSIPDDDLVVVTNFTINDDPASNTNVYDTSYTVNLDTEMFGTGVNYILDPYLPGEGFRMQPLFGFRFISLRETMNQVGVDSGGGIGTPRTTTIYSKVENRVFGPSIGARVEYRHKRFTIGAEPKFTFGFNRDTDQVRTDQLFEASDPVIVSVQKNNEFSPTFQLTLYAKLHLNEHIRCFVGYDYLNISQISRAYDIIDYNEDRTSTVPATGTKVRQNHSKFSADGITGGLEFIW